MDADTSKVECPRVTSGLLMPWTISTHAGPLRKVFECAQHCNAADTKAEAKGLSEGTWNSIHVFEVVSNPAAKKAVYRLTTTVMLTMDINAQSVKTCNLSGSLQRKVRACSLSLTRGGGERAAVHG